MKRVMMALLVGSNLVGVFPETEKIRQKLVRLGGVQSSRFVHCVDGHVEECHDTVAQDDTPLSAVQKDALKQEIKNDIKTGMSVLRAVLQCGVINKDQADRDIMSIYGDCMRIYSEQEMRELFPEVTIKERSSGSFTIPLPYK